MKKATLLKVSLTLALSLSLLTQATGSSASQTDGRRSGRSMSVAPAPVSLTAQRRRAPGALRFAPRRINERNRRFQYTIKASYPQIIGARNANAVEFNRVVRDLIVRESSDFKKDFEPPDPSIPKEIRESSFDASYVVNHSSPDLVSISFSISTYNAGAAHPNHYTVALNYDLNAGRVLNLSDLFKPRSGYMRTISDYAIKELKKKLGPESDGEWIARGAAPDSENYKSWNITRRGLSVTFDPYQVASYAEGQHFVIIPYAALSNVINMDGPLNSLVRTR